MGAHLDFRVKDGQVTEVWCRRTWVRVIAWSDHSFSCSRCKEPITNRIKT